MRIGIFAKTFAGKSLDAILDQVIQNDFETVQFNMACAGLDSLPGVYPVDILQSIKNSLSQHNLSVTAFCSFNMGHRLLKNGPIEKALPHDGNVKELVPILLPLVQAAKTR